MANKPLRIEVPRNVEQELKLGEMIYQQHLNTPNSPLNALVDYDINTMGPKIPKALKLHDQAEATAKMAEELYRLRDAEMGDIDGFIKASRDLLKGVYAKNPKKLGEFGFTVDDTPKAKKKGDA